MTAHGRSSGADSSDEVVAGPKCAGSNSSCAGEVDLCSAEDNILHCFAGGKFFSNRKTAPSS